MPQGTVAGEERGMGSNTRHPDRGEPVPSVTVMGVGRWGPSHSPRSRPREGPVNAGRDGLTETFKDHSAVMGITRPILLATEASTPSRSNFSRMEYAFHYLKYFLKPVEDVRM